MNINFKKVAPSALAGAMTLSGCASTIGGPLGVSQTIIQDKDSCVTQTENSINLFFLGGSVKGRGHFDDDCARQQIIAALLTTDLSNDPRADADMKALALVLAGMQDSEIEDAINAVTEGLGTNTRNRIEGNIRQYRNGLIRQGAARERANSAPQIAALQSQIAQAQQMTITLEKPDYCPMSHYGYIQSELNSAYPQASVIVKNSTLAEMSISIDENAPGVETVQSSLCQGSFMYASARQGVGESATSVRSGTFFQDQTEHLANGGAPETAPRLDPTQVVAHVGQRFPIASGYQP